MANILVVDDHQDLLDMIETCLTLKGYSVTTAISKAALFSALEHYTPDLIILDVMLGDDNGREVCQEIKSKKHRHIPILLYSAAAHTLENYTECEADDILEKPFEIQDLLEKVGRLCKK